MALAACDEALRNVVAVGGDRWDEQFEENWSPGDVLHIAKQSVKNVVNMPAAIANGGINFAVGTAEMVVDGYKDIYYLVDYARTGKIRIAKTDLNKHVPKAKYVFNDKESRSYTKFMEDRTENALQVYYAVKGAAAAYRGGANWMRGLRSSKAPAVNPRSSAQLYADELRGLPASQRPSVAAVLESPTGASVRGHSSFPTSTNSRVADVLDDVPVGSRPPYHGRCAEIHCISKALDEGLDVSGSTISTSTVRGPTSAGHGLPVNPCTSCQAVLAKFGVTYRCATLGDSRR